jgi:hypothetical protein
VQYSILVSEEIAEEFPDAEMRMRVMMPICGGWHPE